MNLEEVLKAAVPDRVTCLGVRLRPLSLGALLLMYRYRNTCVRPLAEQTIPGRYPLGDLLQAVLACSMPFADAQAVLSDPNLKEELRAWAERFRDGKKRGFLKRLFGDRKKVSLAEADRRLRGMIERSAKAFEKYFAEGTKYPFTKRECGPDREIGTPWPFLTITGLMADLGQDFDTAINQPLALSRWLVAANGERTGMLEVGERTEAQKLKEEANAIALEEFAADRRQTEPAAGQPEKIDPRPTTLAEALLKGVELAEKMRKDAEGAP